MLFVAFREERRKERPFFFTEAPDVITGPLFFFFKTPFIYLFERERKRVWGEGQRKRKTLADSLLSSESNARLHLRTLRS